jgi:hypothetical protein
MDKLQTVPQESKTDVLQSGPSQPFQHAVQLPCPWILEKQERKGQPCGKPTFGGDKYCTPHQIKASRREGKEEPSHEPSPSQPPLLPLAPSPNIIHQQLPIQQSSIQHHYQPPQPPPQQSMMSSSDVLAILEIFSRTVIQLQDKYRD